MDVFAQEDPSPKANWVGSSILPKFGPQHPKFKFVLKTSYPFLSFVLASGAKVASLTPGFHCILLPVVIIEI